MNYILKNGKVYDNGTFRAKDILVNNGIIADISSEISANEDVLVFDLSNKYVLPGFLDVHVHLREPGFSYKETIESGTMAAAHGGYTAVFSMPNLSPVPSDFESLFAQLRMIKEKAIVKVVPFGSITVDEKGFELADLESMAGFVAGFSDDGRGVQSRELMNDAMIKARSLNKIISAHCEDNSLLNGGYIHKGEYAAKHDHIGICSESEWKPIERDIELIKVNKCPYHVCHISTKESVELIRKAKAEGVDITCETAPHYLVFNDMMIEDNAKFKMNPPIRSEADRVALVEGIIDGTIDMIATDHAPHSAEEKSKGLSGSLMGVVGLECAFSVMYTEFVKKGILPLEKLVELFSINPRKRFDMKNDMRVGNAIDICVFDPDFKSIVEPEKFFSKGRSTPFEGRDIFGEIVLTICEGNISYCSEKFVDLK